MSGEAQSAAATGIVPGDGAARHILSGRSG